MTEAEFDQMFHRIVVWAKVRSCAKPKKKDFKETLKRNYNIKQK